MYKELKHFTDTYINNLNILLTLVTNTWYCIVYQGKNVKLPLTIRKEEKL